MQLPWVVAYHGAMKKNDFQAMYGSKLPLILLLSILIKISITSSISYGCIEYSQNLVDYGAEAVQAYAQCKHGPDGKLLLDDFISPFFEDFNDKIILDAGCGAGPWSKLAAQKGAIVHGIDIQSKMIEKAAKDVEDYGLEKKTFFQLGDVRALPYPARFFDRAVSINLICNLPGDSDKCESGKGLEMHFTELFRVLQNKGRIIISGPSSMDKILTNGKRPRSEVIREIQLALKSHHQTSFDEFMALKFVEQFTDVLRASFILENGQLALVEDNLQLKPGQKVLRKIPGLALFMYYHPETVVVAELQKAGFVITKIQRPVVRFEQLDTPVDLGAEYANHNPFFIIEAEKPKA